MFRFVSLFQVRQTKLFRKHESGNQVKGILGQDSLQWDKKQPAHHAAPAREATGGARQVLSGRRAGIPVQQEQGGAEKENNGRRINARSGRGGVQQQSYDRWQTNNMAYGNA